MLLTLGDTNDVSGLGIHILGSPDGLLGNVRRAGIRGICTVEDPDERFESLLVGLNLPKI